MTDPTPEWIEEGDWEVRLHEYRVQGDPLSRLSVEYRRKDGLPVNQLGHQSFNNDHNKGRLSLSRDHERDDNGRHRLPR